MSSIGGKYEKELNGNFRPSAIPLITVDPYFSIWSMSDTLYGGVTKHWSGRRNPMTAGLEMSIKVQSKFTPNF